MSTTDKGYYKYQDVDFDSPVGDGVTYIEADSYGRAWRQITVGSEGVLASSTKHPRWGFALAEGLIDYDSIEQVTKITRGEFDEVWNAHLARHAAQWDKAKACHRIGATVRGYIELFYPQGVIVNLGDGAFGIADYEEASASTRPESMSSRHEVTAIVKGYDECNQWIVLERTQVHDTFI